MPARATAVAGSSCSARWYAASAASCLAGLLRGSAGGGGTQHIVEHARARQARSRGGIVGCGSQHGRELLLRFVGASRGEGRLRRGQAFTHHRRQTLLQRGQCGRGGFESRHGLLVPAVGHGGIARDQFRLRLRKGFAAPARHVALLQPLQTVGQRRAALLGLPLQAGKPLEIGHRRSRRRDRRGGRRIRRHRRAAGARRDEIGQDDEREACRKQQQRHGAHQQSAPETLVAQRARRRHRRAAAAPLRPHRQCLYGRPRLPRRVAAGRHFGRIRCRRRRQDRCQCVMHGRHRRGAAWRLFRQALRDQRAQGFRR